MEVTYHTVFDKWFWRYDDIRSTLFDTEVECRNNWSNKWACIILRTEF